MPDLNEDELKQLYARLEEHGMDNVRALLASDGFPTGMKIQVLKWLADQGGKRKKD